MMTVFLLANCIPVFADGIGDTQRSDYPGVTDYRQHPVSLNSNHQKPKARFSIQVKDSAGSVRPGTINSGGNNTSSNAIASSQDSPIITASIGDSITINNLSSPGSGTTINKYDIQYRFVPEGSNRTGCQIHSQIVNNFSSVKNIIEKLPLNETGTYEIFMAVADNAQCLPRATNWSANGNLRTINQSNPNFPNGMFWYFTEAQVKVGGSPPDFYPTPEGSTEWKPSYKDPNICAMTYADAPGTHKNILVNVNNSGTQAITDFKATWYGSGAAGWANPVWDAGEVNIPAGGSQQFTVPVIVPQPGQENRLVFKANVNGQTPSSELNQENNIMIIRVGNPGVDLKVTINPTKTVYLSQQPSSVRPGVTIIVQRVDTGTNSVQATYTYKLPGQPAVTQTVTVPPNSHYSKHYNYNVTQAGSFTTTASAYPIGVEDINPADNTATCTQQVQATGNQYNQQTKDSSPKTKVGLRG